MAHNIPAVFGLNKFLWNYIGDGGAAGLLTVNNYSGLVPIIPNGEVPQFLEAIDEQPGIQSHPYIVYTWYTNGFDGDSWYKPVDTVLYTVFALNSGELNDIVTSIVNLFKRFDVSAAEVNKFIQLSTLSDLYKAYNYSYISVASATGGVAPNIENDPISATITLRVGYTNPVVDFPIA